MSIAAHSRAPRKRTRDDREIANQVAVEEEQKENLATTSQLAEESEKVDEERSDCKEEVSVEDVKMEEDGEEGKAINRPKSNESAASTSSDRRKLTPKRSLPRRRCYSESYVELDVADLIQTEDDLLYGPQLLLNESALQEGYEIPVFNADDIDNILADLETLNLT
ncbi:hypothetical protein QR680_013952 [Steinernema hermaphroditum]|uniref:Uncharacterized protein n=1 Tax=Steinernema hermaphroditum TaxID=289476 RepID=A0AA39I8N1_9BILA|nr:hypothetical protein QR680_013952 [Steinernema hermaphroditum]